MVNIIFFITTIIVIFVFVTMFVFTKKYSSVYDPYKLSFKDVRDVEDMAVYKKNPRVLVFNTYSYPQNKMPAYTDYSTAVNKLYCNKYGYDYIQIAHNIEEMPPYWMRVKDAADLLSSDNYDVIVYMDLDAIFYDFSKPLDVLLSNNYDLYVGRDPAVFLSADFNSLVNSGCFIVKNTNWSKEFLKEWLNACVDEDSEISGVCKNDWKFDGKEWVCQGPGCRWAGIKYEQGMLSNLFLSNTKNSQKHICIFEENVLSNMHPEKPSFVLHLMGNSNNDRIKVFGNFLKGINDKEHIRSE